MSRLDEWHARQRQLSEWLDRLSNRFDVKLSPLEEAITLAKLGLCLGIPFLAAPLLTITWYGFKAEGEAAYYWMAATAFGASILAHMRARELAKTADTTPSRHDEDDTSDALGRVPGERPLFTSVEPLRPSLALSAHPPEPEDTLRPPAP